MLMCEVRWVEYCVLYSVGLVLLFMLLLMFMYWCMVLDVIVMFLVVLIL